MNRLLRVPGSVLRTFSSNPPPTAEQVGRPAAGQPSGPQAEHAQLVHRLEEVREAIKVLDGAPENRTARALLERYRENERRLVTKCRRLELELGELSSSGSVAIS